MKYLKLYEEITGVTGGHSGDVPLPDKDYKDEEIGIFKDGEWEDEENEPGKRYISNLQGTCPVCDSMHLNYEKPDHYYEGVEYRYHCGDCGYNGKEVYSLSFSTHLTDDDRDINIGNEVDGKHFFD